MRCEAVETRASVSTGAVCVAVASAAPSAAVTRYAVLPPPPPPTQTRCPVAALLERDSMAAVDAALNSDEAASRVAGTAFLVGLEAAL